MSRQNCNELCIARNDGRPQRLQSHTICVSTPPPPRAAMSFAFQAIPAPSEFTMIPAPTDSKNCVFLGINGNYEEIKRLQVFSLRQALEGPHFASSL